MQHIGFIMDGNRRWAKKLKNITKIGHDKGSDQIEPMIECCLESHIQYVTFWALSKENILERDAGELTYIYELLEKKIPLLIPKLLDRGVRFEVIGDMWLLPPHIRTLLLDTIEQTQ
jgi:undecaprenyl diphosphate synthase